MKEELKKRLLDALKEYHSLGIAEQINYQKFYLYSIITHSTAIEGSTVTEIENQLLFDEGITAKGRSLQEQMMNLDLKAAYERSMQLAHQHTDFSIEMLKELPDAHIVQKTSVLVKLLFQNCYQIVTSYFSLIFSGKKGILCPASCAR